MRVKEEKEKAGLKLNIKIKKNKLRSCHVDPSVNGKIDGGKVEAVTDTLSLHDALPIFLIPACGLSSLAFYMMYSA